MTIPAQHFYMIRHGETEHNVARLLAGHTDSALTPKGRAQAQAVQDIVRYLPRKPKRIVHSHLSRARDTASIINAVLDVPMHEDPDIAEHFCGDWEEKPYMECERILSGWDTPPNGESFDDFCARIKRCKVDALKAREQPVLIVSHGGVFRGLGRIYGLDTPGVFENCHLYEFEPDPDNVSFPWTVWSHDAVGVRTRSRVFHDSAVLVR